MRTLQETQELFERLFRKLSRSIDDILTDEDALNVGFTIVLSGDYHALAGITNLDDAVAREQVKAWADTEPNFRREESPRPPKGKLS
jgi:hypothetical protein